MNKQFVFSELKPDLQEKLKLLESKVGGLYYISGLRTRSYNTGVGGASDSQHIYGRAVDVARNSFKESPIEIGKIAVECGFTGIGFYDTHIHFDIRPNPNLRGYSFWDDRNNEKKAIAGDLMDKKPNVEYAKEKDNIIEVAKSNPNNVTVNDAIPFVVLTGAVAVAFIMASE